MLLTVCLCNNATAAQSLQSGRLQIINALAADAVKRAVACDDKKEQVCILSLLVVCMISICARISLRYCLFAKRVLRKRNSGYNQVVVVCMKLCCSGGLLCSGAGVHSQRRSVSLM
jgi:hypothetical protein